MTDEEMPGNPHQSWWNQFPARLVSVALINGLYCYGYTEQAVAASTGLFEDGPDPRRGTPTVSPAFESNNRLIDVTNTPLVLLRFHSMVNGQVTYDFDAGWGSLINETINFVNVNITYDNVNITFVTNSVWTINNNVSWTINGPGILIINAPYEICGALFYCYSTHAFTAQVDDWVPTPDKVVRRISTDAIWPLTGIIPLAGGGDFRPQYQSLVNIGEHELTLKLLDLVDSAVDHGVTSAQYPGDSETLRLGGGDVAQIWYDPEEDSEVHRVLSFTGYIPRQQQATAGSLDDFALVPNCESLLAYTPSSGQVTGIAGGQVGRRLRIINLGPGLLTLKHNKVSSAASNRLELPGGVDVILGASEARSFEWYVSPDAVRSPRWQMIGPEEVSVTLAHGEQLTGSNAVTSSYSNIGTPVTLPNVGTYQIIAQVEGQLSGTAMTNGDLIECRLRNNTTSTVLGNRAVCAYIQDAPALGGTGAAIGSATLVAMVTTVAVNEVVYVQGRYSVITGTPTAALALIALDYAQLA